MRCQTVENEGGRPRRRLQEKKEVKRKGGHKTEQGDWGNGWGSVWTGRGRGERGRGDGEEREGTDVLGGC